MDKIDWTKPIETTEGTPRKAKVLRICGNTAALKVDGCFGEHIVTADGQGMYRSEDCAYGLSFLRFRNVRPPVPAACEHERRQDRYFCLSCKQVIEPSPSPSPAPDSVEIAKRIIETRVLNPALNEFLATYAAEQSAQRRAAGELAEVVQKWLAPEHQASTHDVMKALAADASARSGKDGGK